MMISWMLIAAVLIAFIGFWLGRAAHAAHDPTPGSAGSPEHSPDRPYPAAARPRFPLARWLAVAAVACGGLFFVRTQHVQVQRASALRQEQHAVLQAQAARAAAMNTQSADWDGRTVVIGATPPPTPAPLLPVHNSQAVPPATAFAAHVESSRITIVGLIVLPVSLLIASWLLGPWKGALAVLAGMIFASALWLYAAVERGPNAQLSRRAERFAEESPEFAPGTFRDERGAPRRELREGTRQAVEEAFGHLWQRRPEPMIALDTAPVAEPASGDAAVTAADPAVVAAVPSPTSTATQAGVADNASAEPSDAAGAAAGGADAASATSRVAESPGTAAGGTVAAASPEVEGGVAPASAERPAWVDQPPRLVGRVDQRVISAGPYLTLEECVPDLQQAAERAVRDLLRERRQRNELPFELAGEPPLLSDLGLGLDSLLENYCTERYCETLKTSFGQMQQVHALLEFSDAAQVELLHRWRSVLQRERQQRAAAAAGFTVMGVGLAYALLQLDARTHGYYTKRLFLGVPAAIIATLALLTRLA